VRRELNVTPTKVTGRVTSGRNRASALVGTHTDEIEELTGLRCIPGSLNVVLEQPVRLQTESALVFGVDRMLWHAQVGQLTVLAARWRRARLHILELYATVNLRDALSVADGQTITVTMDKADFAPLSQRDALAWHWFWSKGRGHLYYSSDFYKRLTAPVELALGSLQD